MEEIAVQQLIKKAFAVRDRAYAPYSLFTVGAALLCADGKIYQGCNIENAAYPATICAEQAAVAKAISQGNQEFIAIAVCGGPKEQKMGATDYVYPCGNCRQILSEFASADFLIYSAVSPSDYQTSKLAECLPNSFCLKQQED